MQPATSFTISAWAKAVSPGTFRYIISKPQALGVSTYAFYSGQNGGLQGFLDFTTSGGTLGYSYSGTADPGLIWDGTWHFAAESYDGSDFRLYLDGRQVAVLHTNVTLFYQSTNNNGDVHRHLADRCRGGAAGLPVQRLC